MYYTIYKVTNLINQKIYVGMHKTSNLNDDYMGSGKVLKLVFVKYGIKNFKKEIIDIFSTNEEMLEAEANIVNEDFVKNPNTYNLKIGGEGGFDFINVNGIGKIAAAKGGTNAAPTLRLLQQDPDWAKARSDKISKSLTEAYRSGRRKCTVTGNEFRGRTHSKQTKKKIGEANSKHQHGKGNSNYGKCWIYNEELKESRSIPKEQLNDWINLGWIKGRKIKF